MNKNPPEEKTTSQVYYKLDRLCGKVEKILTRLNCLNDFHEYAAVGINVLQCKHCRKKMNRLDSLEMPNKDN